MHQIYFFLNSETDAVKMSIIPAFSAGQLEVFISP